MSRRALGPIAVAVLIVLGGAVLLTGGTARAAVPAAIVPCPEAPGPATVTGSAAVAGGPLPTDRADGLPLVATASMEELVTNLTTGAVVSESCVATPEYVTTNASAGFVLTMTPPATTCGPGASGTVVCTSWTGPYGNVSMTTVASAPLGYEVVSGRTGTVYSVVLAALLGAVAIAPGDGSVRDAPTAPIALTATPLTGIGTVSPLSVTYAWAVSGSGWALDAGNGPTAAVTPSLGAAAAEITVRVATAQGLTFEENATTTEPLVPVATALGALGENRSIVDVGGWVELRANATGAPGVPYSATFATGPAAAPVPATCTTAALPDGDLAVACAAEVVFLSVGQVAASVNVTNGYSSAVGALPVVNVTAPPRVDVGPGAPVGYAGLPLRVTVSAVPGDGVPPYARACFAPGTGQVVCAAGPGPSWTFDPVYSAPGNFTAQASITDADGVNRSATDVVRIVAPLDLSTPSGVLSATVGTPVELTASLAGGDLPGAFWWNLSGTAGSVAHGSVRSDGTLAVSVVPSTVGTLRGSLTVVDALGTSATVAIVLATSYPNASAIRPAGTTTPADVPVGTGVAISWQADDPAGGVVPTFAASAVVRLTVAGNGTPVPGWVNASGIGLLASSGAGAFSVPADAWVAGELTLTVTPGLAGTVRVELGGPSLPGPVGAVTLLAEPNLLHLQLAAPHVATAGLRTNATRWEVFDRFGDPAPGATVVVELAAPGGEVATTEVATPLPGGAAAVWVNYSAGPGGATVRVLDGSGDILLGPISVPALAGAPARPSPLWPVGLALPIGVVFAAVPAVRRRASRGRARPLEDELLRLADGRAAVVAIVEQLPGAAAEAIAAAWEPPPAPAELPEWIASLVTDGTLRAETEPHGGTGYRVVAAEPRVARVTLDADALDRAIARRALEADGTADDAT